MVDGTGGRGCECLPVSTLSLHGGVKRGWWRGWGAVGAQEGLVLGQGMGEGHPVTIPALQPCSYGHPTRPGRFPCWLPGLGRAPRQSLGDPVRFTLGGAGSTFRASLLSPEQGAGHLAIPTSR